MGKFLAPETRSWFLPKRILMALQRSAYTALDLLDEVELTARAIGDLHHTPAYYEMEKSKLRKARWSDPDLIRFEELRKRKHYFYTVLARLQKQGIIQKKKRKFGSAWFLTKLGKKRLAEPDRRIARPSHHYKREPTTELILVIFDIPEKLKEWRNWLRAVLISLEFGMLQKSVWLGQVKLPDKFLQDIHELRLEKYIQIFTVARKGTLEGELEREN